MFSSLRAFLSPLPILAAASFVLLAACGGGGGGGASVATPRPDITPTITVIALPAPNDSATEWRNAEFSVNYGLGAINADAAYQRNYFGQGATVAVVDSGVRGTHANLRGNILSAAARRFGAANTPLTDGALTDPTTVISVVITTEMVMNNITNTVTNTVGRIIGSHGTGVAGVIAGTFDRAEDRLGHGVAPHAKILPVRFSDDFISTITSFRGENINYHLRGNAREALRYAANQNVHIINNSWGNGHPYLGHYGADRSATIVFAGPLLPQLFTANMRGFIRGEINNYANIFRNRDIAVVWSAGNDRWNSINGTVQTYEAPNYTRPNLPLRLGNTYTPQELVDNFVAVAVNNGGATVSLTLSDAGFEPDGIGDYALAPLYHSGLRGKWLAVVATDQRNSIAWFSNGCGSQGKYWCLAAPGVRIATALALQDRAWAPFNGTSFSAPHVSGALALLKSRFPQMPMSVLVHLLLTTATDLGEPGVDDVYGHGLVNIADAISLQGNVNVPTDNTMPTVILLPAPNPASISDWRNAEFNVNYGLGAINADAAYRRNYFGQGATVAVVDAGVRGTHINLTGNLLTNAARSFPIDGSTITMGALTDTENHGTGVANIIAGTFDAEDDTLGHGVAPRAKVLPLSIAFTESGIAELAALRYAADQNVHIINNSWGDSHFYFGHYAGDRSATIFFRAPILQPLLQLPQLYEPVRGELTTYADTFGNRDIAVVWAVGNDGWNSINSSIETITNEDYTNARCEIGTCITTFRTAQQLVDNFVAVQIINNATVSITLNRPSTVNGIAVDAFEPNGFGAYPLAPLHHPQLRGKWLAVVATDQNNSVAVFSNGCGSRGKHWCLAAPGVNITTASSAGDNARRRADGTSFAAPHVSGALALLKSRLPQMPMSVLVHLLLTTATDLGEPGVDDVYGHGLVNIARAITMQGNIALPLLSSQGVLLQNANTELPSSFAGFADRLNGIGVAVNYLDGFYYDAPIGGMIKAQSKKQPPHNFAAELFGDAMAMDDDGVFALSRNGAVQAAGWQGGAFQFRHNFYNKPSLWQNDGDDITRRPFFADDGGYSDEMLVDIGDNWRMFAARGEEQQAEYSQMGIAWRHQLSSLPKLRLAAAHSHIREDDTLLGGGFGGVMPLADGGYIRQTDIGASWALDDKWRLFGAYQLADVDAKIGGIVAGISGVAAEGWSGGFAASNWLRKGDAFRIGIGRQTHISRGDMILRINQSSNPQEDESTKVIRNRGYETVERRISLSDDAPLYFTLGYGFAPGDNSRLAVAITHRHKAPSAVSIDWRWDF